MTFYQTASACGHTVLKIFVSSQSQDMLSYFLGQQPELEKRVQFYQQITDAVSHLHAQELVLCFINPMFIRVIDEGIQVCLGK